MNKVFLKGRLGSDVKLTITPKGTAIAKFSLAVPDKFDPKNKDKTYWASMVVWGKLAEICGKYLTKGQEVLFEGHLTRSTWEKDGVKHYRDEVTADSMEFCGSKGEKQTAAQEGYDDIPF